jgi:hypothetical protein
MVVPRSVSKMKTEFEGMIEAKGALPFLSAMVDPMNENPQRAPDMQPASTSAFSFPYAEQGVGCVPRWDYSASQMDVKQIDETVVYVSPGTVNNIWVSKSEVDTYPAQTNLGDWVFTGTDAAPLQQNASNNARGINCSFLFRRGNQDSTHGASYNVDSQALGGIMPRVGYADLGGFGSGEFNVYELPITPGGTDATVIQFAPCTGDDGTVGGAKFGRAVLAYRAAGTSWYTFSVWPTQLAVAAGTQSIGMWGYSFTISSALSLDQVIFIPPDTYSDENWMMIIDTNASNAELSIGGRPTHYDVTTFRDASSVADPREARCTALSCLVSYMGNDVANGGVIASARLSPGTTPAHAYQGDMFSWIQSLPKSNYHGALKDGSYVWWCPQSTGEILPRAYRGDWNVYGQNTTLLTVFRRDSANDATYGLQNMRLVIQQHTEVWNDSNLYEHEIRPYVMNFEKLMHVLVQQTAATENPLHTTLIRNLKTGIRKLISNPENWRKLLTWTGRTIFKLPV